MSLQRSFFVQEFRRDLDRLKSLIEDQTALSMSVGISFTESNQMSLPEVDMIREAVKSIHNRRQQQGSDLMPGVVGKARMF